MRQYLLPGYERLVETEAFMAIGTYGGVRSVTTLTRRRTTISILCIALLLFVSSVSAAEIGSAADSRTTLRASTSAAGSPLVQVATDSPGAAGQPSWIGLFVLVFGGLLAGLWLVAGALSALWAIGDTRLKPLAGEIPPSPNRSKRDEAPPADLM